MKRSELETRLIAAARAHSPSDHVPFAFEKRVMAHLNWRPVSDIWTLWAGALWRAAGACLAVVLLVGAVAVFGPRTSPSNPSGDLTQDFENTMLAGVNQDID